MLSTRFTHKLAKLAQLEPDDLAVLQRLEILPKRLERGEDIITEGDNPEAVHLVQSGLACRYKMLEDGRRHITAFLIPGDACDLNIYILSAMDHSIGVLAAADVISFPRSAMEELLDRPRIARALLKSTLIDEATLRQWLVNMGKRPTGEAMAHLFCELHLRMSMVDLTATGQFSLPMTQEDLADTLGVSSVHANRTLQDLRTQNLVQFDGKAVDIPDIARLQRFANFDPDYLHLGH